MAGLFSSTEELTTVAKLMAMGYGQSPMVIYVEHGREQEAQGACSRIDNADFHVNPTGLRSWIRIER
jgi:hypothetical protein